MRHLRLALVAILCALFAATAYAGIILKTQYLGSLNNDLLFAKRKGFRSSEDAPVEQWFTEQRVDHFNPLNTATWKQRFFVNDTYWDKENGGPVFIALGGEGPISPAYVTGKFILNEYAKLFKALIVGVEHRFYGKSNPTSDLSTENLRLLTTEQALADFAYFRQHIARLYKVPHHAKFVAFGGSYSGNLSAWIRLKYPQLFAASIASSAPVRAEVDFPEYMDIVADSIGEACTARIRAATDVIDQMLDSPTGTAQLQTMFGACKPIQTSIDKTVFVSSLADPVQGVVQYNNDNNNYQPMNISSMCRMLQGTQSDAIKTYASFIKLYNQLTSTSCTQSTYGDYLSQLQDTRTFAQGNDNAAGRSWTWQYCTEYGYLQYSRGKKQPFSERITRDFFFKQCEDTFGIKGLTPNTNAINTEYGSDKPAATNVIFTNGKVDPWHFLGVLKDVSKSEPAYLMDGTAHCADLYASRSADLPDLTATRLQQVAHLKQWLDA